MAFKECWALSINRFLETLAALVASAAFSGIVEQCNSLAMYEAFELPYGGVNKGVMHASKL